MRHSREDLENTTTMTNRVSLGSTYLVLLAFFAGCEPPSDRPHRCNVMEEFNTRAKEQIQGNFDEIDLYPMSDREKCILRETISKFLDELNDYKLIQIDSFYVRNYTIDGLGVNISIVMKEGQYYLLCLPRLYEYWYTDRFYQLDEGAYQLSGAEFSIARVNSSTFDEFISKEMSIGRDRNLTFRRLMVMLESIFPELMRREIDYDEIQNWLSNQPVNNRNVIESVTRPIFDSKRSLRYPTNWRAFRLDHLGYVIFYFSITNEVSHPLSVDIYFLPFAERYGMFYETDDVAYKSCYP